MTLCSDLETMPAEGLKVKWTCAGDDGQRSEGEMPFKLGEIGTIETSLQKPGFIKIVADLVDAKAARNEPRTRLTHYGPPREKVRF